MRPIVRMITLHKEGWDCGWWKPCWASSLICLSPSIPWSTLAWTLLTWLAARMALWLCVFVLRFCPWPRREFKWDYVPVNRAALNGHAAIGAAKTRMFEWNRQRDGTWEKGRSRRETEMHTNAQTGRIMSLPMCFRCAGWDNRAERKLICRNQVKGMLNSRQIQ